MLVPSGQITKLTVMQKELEARLQKAKDHGVEARISSHVAEKMEEVNPTAVQWKAEVAMRREEEQRREEEARRAEEARRGAPSVSFKPTGLLGGKTASDKAKDKAKDRPLVHAENARMSVNKVSTGLPYSSSLLTNSRFSGPTRSYRATTTMTSRWKTSRRRKKTTGAAPTVRRARGATRTAGSASANRTKRARSARD